MRRLACLSANYRLVPRFGCWLPPHDGPLGSWTEAAKLTRNGRTARTALVHVASLGTGKSGLKGLPGMAQPAALAPALEYHDGLKRKGMAPAMAGTQPRICTDLHRSNPKGHPRRSVLIRGLKHSSRNGWELLCVPGSRFRAARLQGDINMISL